MSCRKCGAKMDGPTLVGGMLIHEICPACCAWLWSPPPQHHPWQDTTRRPAERVVEEQQPVVRHERGQRWPMGDMVPMRDAEPGRGR